MIITINTKEDSKDEIKRAIQMLMRLVEHQNEYKNDFNPILPGMNSTDSSSSDSAAPSSAGIFGLFDNPSSVSGTQQEDNKETEEKIEIWEY